MTREEIVRGLRCSASTGDKDCGKCPWGIREEFEGGTWESCDCDRMAVEAADLLENDRSQILALQRELELKRAQLDCAAASAEKPRRRNAAEYCEDIELALDLLERRGGVGPDECVIYLEEAVGVLVSPEEHIRLWAKSDGGTACVWKGEARRLPPELRKLPLLRFSGRAPEETEVVGYLEIETELPEGWRMKDAAGCGHPALRETGARADVGIGPYERASGAAVGMEDGTLCPRCGGRVYHTVGGKKFCSLCLEEMRRE